MESKRITEGAKRVPGRNVVVPSKGAPKITSSEDEKSLSQPKKLADNVFLFIKSINLLQKIFFSQKFDKGFAYEFIIFYSDIQEPGLSTLYESIKI
jgi:hypothetical protein